MREADRKGNIFMSDETPELEELEIVETITDGKDTVVVVKEPLRHQIGKQALGFAMAFAAERVSDSLYEFLLKSYRKWRVR